MAPKNSQKTNFSGPLAGGFAGVIFLTFLFALHLELVVSLVLAAALFVGFFLVLGVLFSPQTIKVNLGDPGQSQEAQRLLNQGRNLVDELEDLGNSLGEKALVDPVKSLVEVCRKILSVLEEDPAKVHQARSFLGTTLESCLSILRKYLEISASGVDSPASAQTRDRLLAILPQMVKAFENQLARLMENNLMDLDAEIKTLETVFKSEG